MVDALIILSWLLQALEHEWFRTEPLAAGAEELAAFCTGILASIADTAPSHYDVHVDMHSLLASLEEP